MWWSALAPLLWVTALHAEPAVPSVPAICPQATEAAPCPSSSRSLRALRLQNAVQNGDLSPAEANRLMQQQNTPPDKTFRDHGDSSTPASPPRHKHSHRYWREQRQHLDAVSPPSDPD